MTITPVTTLTLHLSQDFVQGILGTPGTTQGGTWVYLWYNLPPGDVDASPYLPGAPSNFTPVITEGALTPNVVQNPDGTYSVTVTLTDTGNSNSQPTVSGGTIYLLVQSENPADHHDLTTLIGSTEGNIQPNVQNWNYGFAQFEFTLSDNAADQGDLTAISGFAQHLAVNINYTDSTSDSRGYAITGSALTTDLTNAESSAAFTYPSAPSGLPYSPLDGTTSMVVSPSNGNFGSTYYPSSNWNSYIAAFASLTDVVVSGVTNGEADASGIWHNGQYYSYTMQAVTLAAGSWGGAGTYFLFSPTAASQTKGYMLISEATLEQNLYAAGQGTLTLWEGWDSTNNVPTDPYVVPGSGLPPGTAPTSNAFNPSTNNEWGNIFTNVFTGFTAGYWGTVSQQSNPLNRGTTNNLAGGPLDLDNSQNWSPSYAFDVNRANTIPTYQHNDAYTQEFFNESNVYGSAFSDNLSNGLTPGPLISLASQPGSSTDVGNIDLYVYGPNETDPYYRTPVGANYLPLPTGELDYLTPTQTPGLQLKVVGQAAGLFVDAGVSAKLGIYEGSGEFTYVPLQTGGNLWQNYNVTGGPGSWSVTPGGANVQGTFFINNLPTPASATAGQVYWYQLVFSDTSGDQKVFDFYATAAGTLGQVQTGSTSVAADGGAVINLATLTPTQIELDLNPASSLPSGLLTFAYNTQFAPMPAAPVVGTLSAEVFTATDDQNGTGILGTEAPSVTIEAAGLLAFGWTGTNNGTHTGMATNPVVPSAGPITPGLITSYTNKIVAGDVAQIGFFDTTTDETLHTTLLATADLDGQWQTSTTAQLGNGTYSVTMTELLPDASTPFAPASATLTINVDIPTLTLQQTGDGSGLEFAPHASLGVGGGNWIHLDGVPTASLLPQGADLLLYATMPDGTLVARDGHTGSDVTLDDATLAKIGAIRSDSGVNLLAAHQTLFLPDDEQLHFAILNPDGTINTAPGVSIAAQGQYMAVNAGGMGLSVAVDNILTDQTYLGSEQRSAGVPIVYLAHNDSIEVNVAGSADNVNAVHFVRFDVDPSTGAWSVGGVAYGNTDGFRAAVQANWDQGFAAQDGNGTFQLDEHWSVAGKTGFYAPVMVTQGGDIFVIGTANVDGHEHIRTLGENTFGFEDLRADQHSDFDYNDMVVHLTVGHLAAA